MWIVDALAEVACAVVCGRALIESRTIDSNFNSSMDL